jgi:hypothetical protein
MVEYSLCTLSAYEALLLDAATEVAFGELHHIEMVPSRPDEAFTRRITEQQLKFLNIVRELGAVSLDKVLVQNGVPVFLEMEGENNGIQFTKKYKI